MPKDRHSLIYRVWRDAPVLSLALVAALAVAGFFAARLILGAIYWADPAHSEVPLAGWMTPRFAAMSWQVPPTVIGDTLGLDRDGTGKRMTLAQIAEETGVPLTTLIAELESAIAAHRDAHRDAQPEPHP
jgi:hypothetical protein